MVFVSTDDDGVDDDDDDDDDNDGNDDNGDDEGDDLTVTIVLIVKTTKKMEYNKIIMENNILIFHLKEMRGFSLFAEKKNFLSLPYDRN